MLIRVKYNLLISELLENWYILQALIDPHVVGSDANKRYEQVPKCHQNVGISLSTETIPISGIKILKKMQ